MARADFGFDRSVFVNCPFDPAYRPLLRALLFTVLDCGLQPRIAVESADSGQVRIEKIRKLISETRFSIHDLSRMSPLGPEELPRFNMPFELGVDLGCRFYGVGEHQNKSCLILDTQQYRYQSVLSDISGQDIRAHDDQPEKLVSQVRGWLRVTTRGSLRSGSDIWQRFNNFTSWLERHLMARGFTADEIQELEVAELIENAQFWVNPSRAPHRGTHHPPGGGPERGGRLEG